MTKNFYQKLDSQGKPIPGASGYWKTQPKVGKWLLVDGWCCAPTTTTTTSTTTTTTTTVAPTP